MTHETDETDEELALEYLGHKRIQRGSVTDFVYLEEGSDRERQCIGALIRILRGPEEVSAIIRWRLAGLFDPDHTVEARKLTIVRRRAGGINQPSEARDIAIARDLAAAVAVGDKLDSAVRAAELEYGVSRPTVMRAWKDNGKIWNN